MAKFNKIKVELTESELWDIITCLESCYDHGYSYGQVQQNVENLLEANRKRLITKLKSKSLTCHLLNRDI